MPQSDKNSEELMDIQQNEDKEQVSPKLQYTSNAQENELVNSDDDRNRTPSGSVPLRRVQDIRKYYSPDKTKGQDTISKGSDSASMSDSQKSINCEIIRAFKVKAKKLAKGKGHGRPHGHASSPLRQNKQRRSNRIKNSKKTKTSESADADCQYTSEDESDYSDDDTTSNNSSSRKFFEAADLSDPSEELLHHIAAKIQPIKPSSNVSSVQNNMGIETMSSQAECQRKTQRLEGNENDNPQVLSVSVVAELLREIKGDIATLKEKVDRVETDKASEISDKKIEECAKGIEMAVTENLKKENSELKLDVGNLKHKNSVLCDVVQRMHVEMEDIKSRLENLELGTSKKAVSISGLTLKSTKKDDMILEVQSFIEIHLGVIVVIEDIYPLGNNQPRMLIVHFQTMQEKRDVLHFKAFLKDVRVEGKKVYINEYTPIISQERRKKEKFLRDNNETLQNPAEIKYTKGALTVNGAVFKSKVSVPSPRDLIELSPEELTAIFAKKLDTTQSFQSEKSVFQGYIAPISSLKDVNDLYKRVKLSQPGARHIVCAYWIDSNHIEPHYAMDYCDDDEHGAGKHIMDYIRKNNLKNKVIFVSRKYGGIRMGAERFKCYVQAAAKASEKITGFYPLRAGQT